MGGDSKFVAELHNVLCSRGYPSAAPTSTSIEDSLFVDSEASPEPVCMIVGQDTVIVKRIEPDVWDGRCDFVSRCWKVRTS